ncbi:DUF2283 domain-containing protein [Candidatus Gottesmanbacteria bacterium]|nr:DUF2283 domain-containing protein [Candidatus Gottesmanbacteria bacterium]
MSITYDKQTDILSIDLAKGRYEVSKKITDRIIVDVTKQGKVLGIEILDASETIQSFNPTRLMSGFRENNVSHAVT